MKKARLSVIPGLAFALAASATEPGATVTTHDLANAPNLLGRRVVVHGCLVFAPPHSQYIHTCGSDDSRDITLVRDEKLVGVAAYGNTDMGEDVEGVFSGTLIEIPAGAGKWIVLELESARRVTPHEP